MKQTKQQQNMINTELSFTALHFLGESEARAVNLYWRHRWEYFSWNALTLGAGLKEYQI